MGLREKGKIDLSKKRLTTGGSFGIIESELLASWLCVFGLDGFALPLSRSLASFAIHKNNKVSISYVTSVAGVAVKSYSRGLPQDE
jgi:hypothetical protein